MQRISPFLELLSCIDFVAEQFTDSLCDVYSIVGTNIRHLTPVRPLRDLASKAAVVRRSLPVHFDALLALGVPVSADALDLDRPSVRVSLLILCRLLGPFRSLWLFTRLR